MATRKKIDPTLAMRTILGRCPVTLYTATHPNREFPLVGRIGEGSAVLGWDAYGQRMPGTNSPVDIENVPDVDLPPETGYINIYSFGVHHEIFPDAITAEVAGQQVRNATIPLSRIKIQWKPGQFDA